MTDKTESATGAHVSLKDKPQSGVRLGVFALAILNIAAIVSLRGMPAEAEYGLSSAFYYLLAAICFLIPVSLVAAELTTGWPQKGGVFRWVGEAFGPRWGFLAIWLQWIESTIWYPTVLTFAAVSIAFIGPNQTADQALASNRIYSLIVVLVVYWLSTVVALRGFNSATRLVKWGTMIGTIIPAALLIAFGIAYWSLGKPLQIDMEFKNFWPDFSKFSNLVLAASIFLFYAGMELSAVHVKEIKNPRRNYPIAVLISAIVTVIIFVCGTLALGFIIPKSQINLVQSLLVGFNDFLREFGLSQFAWLIAAALAFGVLAQVTAWVTGPSKGLLEVGRAGYLPPWFQKVNKNDVQQNILLLQAIIVTILSVLFVILPSVQSAYQVMSQLTIILYLIMYMLMFGAAIYLRYAEPTVERTYRIPGGNVGMWIVGGLGFIASLLAFALSFVPPSQIKTGSTLIYILVLVIGAIVFSGIPLIIYALRKPHWQTLEGSERFEPFLWQLKTRAELRGKPTEKGKETRHGAQAVAEDRGESKAAIPAHEPKAEAPDAGAPAKEKDEAEEECTSKPPPDDPTRPPKS